MVNLQIHDFLKTYSVIKEFINKTPLLNSIYFSDMYNNSVYLKCENLQKTNAYKIRGALNKLSTLPYSEQLNGVICASAGNHAQGVALASNLFGIASTIVMPIHTPKIKIESTARFTNNIILHGESFDDAYEHAKKIALEKNLTFIHPFNDIEIIKGQGTIALEIYSDCPDIDYIICPIGGGGLISGVALAAKALNPKIKIIGVQAEGANAMKLSYDSKQLTSIDTIQTIADGISVKRPGDLTFSIIENTVDDIITVSDEEITYSLVELLKTHKILVEPSAITSLCALKKLNITNKKIACVLSGGNIDMSLLKKFL